MKGILIIKLRDRYNITAYSVAPELLETKKEICLPLP